MPYPVLPKLSINIPLASGTWRSFHAAMVGDIADGLEVPDRLYDLKSIPDVWARPLLFEQALYAANQPARKQAAEAEWRGLLALLALRRMRALGNISFEPIFGSQVSTLFIEVIDRLRPDRLVDAATPTQWQNSSILRETSWSDSSVILLDGKAIGMTCPTSLVVTGADYSDKIDSKRIPWFSDGRLQEPKKFLATAEQQAVADWALTVHNFLSDAGAAGPKWLSLSTALRDFVTSLVGREDNAKLLEIEIDTRVQGRIFSVLGFATPRTAPPSGDGIPLSDLELRVSRSPKPTRRAIILEPNAEQQWGRPLTNIMVHGTLPLDAALRDNNPVHRDTVAGVSLDQADWYTAQDFFTNKLYFYEVDKAFPGASALRERATLQLENKAISVILPIRKRWLQWMTAEDLADRVSVRSDGNSIKVILNLPLTGGDLRITKEYSAEDRKNCGQRIPTCKIWPNLNPANWKAFYTYYDNNGGNADIVLNPFTPAPPDSRRMLPLPSDSRDSVAEVWRTRTFPEAMLASQGNDEAGMILVDQPRLNSDTGAQWNIGVDFGTTGTAVFYTAGSRDVGHPVLLQSRLLSVTSEPGAARGNTDKRFLPSLEEDAGALLSIYHDFHASDPEVANTVQPLTEGRIVFVQDPEKFEAPQSGLVTNMKWGGTRERALGLAFLRQLAMQVCAEAAASSVSAVSWRFSFPTAFSNTDLQDFTSIWRKVVERSAELTGIHWANPKQVPEAGDGLFQYKNESVATAHCFLVTERAFLRDGAVCIDIGGGTTDLAIWQDDKIVAQESFRFAGRDLFLNLLHRRPSVLQILGRDISKLDKAQSLDEFYSQIDVLLKVRKSQRPERNSPGGPTDVVDQVMSQLPIVAAEPLMKGFMELLELGIAGILHYAGLVIQTLAEEKKLRQFMPNIYIGGNGSKILHWCASGAYRTGTEADQKFKKVFARATGFQELGKTPFQIVLSRAPKSEVAHGLLIDVENYVEAEHVDYFAEVEKDPPLLSGESFTVSNQKKEWNSYITKSTDLAGARIDPELPQLSALFRNLGLPSDAGFLRQCSSEVNQLLGGQVQSREARRVEPVFITALRVAYEEKAKLWESTPVSKKESARATRA